MEHNINDLAICIGRMVIGGVSTFKATVDSRISGGGIRVGRPVGFGGERIRLKPFLESACLVLF